MSDSNKKDLKDQVNSQSQSKPLLAGITSMSSLLTNFSELEGRGKHLYDMAERNTQDAQTMMQGIMHALQDQLLNFIKDEK